MPWQPCRTPRIVLPYALPDSLPPEVPYRKGARPIRLLLVEDNPADVRLLQVGLEEAQATYTLQVAQDGEAAAHLLAQIRATGNPACPDLIFLDLNLPKRSGHEVLTQLKADPQLRLIPVILLTSSQAPADILAAYRSGANSYLQKPATLEDTLDLMRTIEHYWLDLALLPEESPSPRGPAGL